MMDIYSNSCVDGKFFKDKYGSKPEVDKVKNFLYRKLKSGDWYITADEAVYYGFADEVINTWQKLKS